MKNNLLLFTLLITAGCTLQAMDPDQCTAAAGAGAGAEQQQEICNNPDCTQSADKHCRKCTVSYCNAECQRTDWPGHKYWCLSIISCHLKGETPPEDLINSHFRGISDSEKTILLKLLREKSQDTRLHPAQRRDLLTRMRLIAGGTFDADHVARIDQLLKQLQQPEGVPLTAESLRDLPQLGTLLTSEAGLKNAALGQGVAPKQISAYKQLTRICAQCGKSGTMSKCSRCKAASYCDKDCQKAHWPTHKAICHQARTKNASKK